MHKKRLWLVESDEILDVHERLDSQLSGFYGLFYGQYNDQRQERVSAGDSHHYILC